MMDRADYPGAVDVARYAILEREGGIYLDCDWYPARDDIGFHDLLPLLGLTALAEDIPRNTGAGALLLANSFIAAPPGHPVLARLTAALPAVLAEMPRAACLVVHRPADLHPHGPHGQRHPRRRHPRGRHPANAAPPRPRSPRSAPAPRFRARAC